MHPVRKQRLFTVLFIVIASSIAIGLIVFVIRDNLNAFYPPSKIVSGEVPEGVTIRGGGCVVPGSIERSKNDLKVQFDITDGSSEVTVTYEGLLPDLFNEGEAAVVTGIYNNGVFEAQEVLAKHDENYTPKEVEDTVQNTKEHQNTCKGLTYDS